METDHDNQKWFVLESFIDDCPAVTKRTTISVAALVADPTLLERSKAKLIADVAEYHANFLALQNIDL